MILADWQIENCCSKYGMIDPYVTKQIRSITKPDTPTALHYRIVSYGMSSYGYDIRVDNKFKIFTNINSVVIDPKDFGEKSFHDFVGDVCIIPPNSFALACSVERFTMPNNVTALVCDKSTYRRTGILVSGSVLEAGWRGILTLEISNTTPLPAKVYANEGIAQLLFFQGAICETSYSSRRGKYMDQEGIVLPRL